MKNHEEGTRTDLVVTPLPLTPYGCQRVWGAPKREPTGMVKGRGRGVGWGGVVYVWDSVDPEVCNVGVWTRAPTPAGVQGGRGLTSVSPWPGAGREREGFLRSPRGCGRWAARAPGPEGGAHSPGAREPGQVRGCSGGRSGLRWLGKAGTRCLPASNRHRGGVGSESKSRMPGSTSREASCLSWALEPNRRRGQLAGPLAGLWGC